MTVAEIKAKFPKLVWTSDAAEAQLMKALAHAQARGLLDQFLEQLKRLENLCHKPTNETRIGKDFAPYSFTWSGCMFGGLIYHGPSGGGGGAPEFSVSMESDEGWSIHT